MRLQRVLYGWLLMSAAAVPMTASAQAFEAPATAIARPTMHVTHTYLRAAPGKRAQLIDYIERNWFAMDRIGIERGLFTSYALLERGTSSEADWDVVVTVGYPTIAGHDAPGVADAFRAIRAAHREILIEGQGLAALGSIVAHHPLTLVDQGS